MNEQEELITSGEAAKIAGISRQRINELAAMGRLGRQVAGRYWVFTREEVQEYMVQSKLNKGGRPKDELNLTMKYEAPVPSAR